MMEAGVEEDVLVTDIPGRFTGDESQLE